MRCTIAFFTNEGPVQYKGGTTALAPTSFFFHFQLFSNAFLQGQGWTILQEKCPEESERNAFQNVEPLNLHTAKSGHNDMTKTIVVNVSRAVFRVAKMSL